MKKKKDGRRLKIGRRKKGNENITLIRLCTAIENLLFARVFNKTVGSNQR